MIFNGCSLSCGVCAYQEWDYHNRVLVKLTGNLKVFFRIIARKFLHRNFSHWEIFVKKSLTIVYRKCRKAIIYLLDVRRSCGFAWVERLKIYDLKAKAHDTRMKNLSFGTFLIIFFVLYFMSSGEKELNFSKSNQLEKKTMSLCAPHLNNLELEWKVFLAFIHSFSAVTQMKILLLVFALNLCTKYFLS